MERYTYVSAKTTIDDVKYHSAITVDWSDMTVEDVQALAQRALVIRKQNDDRLAKRLPGKEYTLFARDYKLGVRHARAPAMTPEQALAALSPDALLQLLKDKGLA